MNSKLGEKMNIWIVSLPIVGFLLVLGSWGVYLSSISSGKVPVWPIGSIITQCIGMLLGIGATVSAFRSGVAMHPLLWIPVFLSIGMGLAFLGLLSIRKTPIGDLKVQVGDSILAFETQTSEGQLFRMQDRLGQRTLLKFFRGGW